MISFLTSIWKKFLPRWSSWNFAQWATGPTPILSGKKNLQQVCLKLQTVLKFRIKDGVVH
ncbi:hypothetical protein Hdeb2414_s0045g00745721 [Helianthus debilis subsp. tardiflorus]